MMRRQAPPWAVLVTHQAAVNANRSWSAWKNIGGRCASTPVPFTTPAGRLELFCRTLAGTAALTRWTGQVWTAWQQVGASPANLTATPAVVASAAGQVELLATTAGAMAGSPAVWVSAAGVPGAAVLAASSAMAAVTYRNGSWTALARLGGQF